MSSGPPETETAQNAEKEQTDTEAAEDVKMAEYADFPAVVVHNLPRGVDRNYVVCLVESLVPAEEHLLCRLKDADDHTTSAELVLVSDDAAQRAIDGLYGRLVRLHPSSYQFDLSLTAS